MKLLIQKMGICQDFKYIRTYLSTNGNFLSLNKKKLFNHSKSNQTFYKLIITYLSNINYINEIIILKD